MANFCRVSSVYAEELEGSDRPADLRGVEENLEQARKKSTELDIKALNLNKEVTSLQKEMITLAAKIREREERLTFLEDELNQMKNKKADKEKQLQIHSEDISKSIGAMARISSKPVAAAFVIPGDAGDSFIASSALHSVTSELRYQSDSIKNEIEEIRGLTVEIEEKRLGLEDEKKKLGNSRLEMDAKLKQRQKELAKYRDELNKTRELVDDLSRKSQSIKELIAKLEEQKKKEVAKKVGRDGKESKEASKKELANLADFPFRLPASGKVITRYGDKLDANSTSKGIRISTRDNAEVTAPLPGEVAFTGKFMGYGKILIIRNHGGYHTLLSGLSKISVSPGEKVVQGMPLGVMGNSKDSDNELYFEVRRNNKSVDPSSLFKSNVSSR